METGAKKTIFWDPNGSNRFIIGGENEVKMYAWNADKGEMRHVSVKSDISPMRALAWSPHTEYDDLIAVGLASGRVDLMRLGAPMVSRSPNEPSSAFQAPPVVSLPVRQRRPCTALGFCQSDPNYLAVGLEKVRNESSLIIWDVESASAVFSVTTENIPTRPLPRIPRANVPQQDSRILQQYGASETVSSLCFIPNSTYMLLAGVSARSIYLYDLRSISYSSQSPLSVSTKAAYGLCCDPFDSHRFASYDEAGVKVWDHRKFTEPILTFSEIDATADGGNSPGIPDGLEFSSIRRGLLASHMRDDSHVGATVQSKSAPTDLSATKPRWPSPSNILVWGSPSEREPTLNEKPSHDHSRPILANTRRSKLLSKPITAFAFVPHPPARSNVPHIVTISREGDLELTIMRDSPRHTWSCRGDLVASTGKSYKIYQAEAEAQPAGEPWDIVIYDEFLPKAHDDDLDSPQFSRSSRRREDFPRLPRTSGGASTLTVTRMGRGGRTFSPGSLRRFPLEKYNSSPLPTPTGLSAESEDHTPMSTAPLKPSNRSKQRLKSKGDSRMGERLMHQDISMLMKRRVLHGYGLQSMNHNAAVTEGEKDSVTDSLSELWAWLQNSQTILNVDPEELYKFDFAFQGLLPIWEGLVPLSRMLEAEPGESVATLPWSTGSRSRKSSTVTLPHSPHSPTGAHQGNLAAAVAALNARQGRRTRLPTLPPDTEKSGERLLSLTLCGWDQSDEDLIRRVAKMEKDGGHSQAACWAVFMNQYGKAIDFLIHSKDERQRIMSGTLAALTSQLRTEPKSPDWSQHYEQVAARLEDPYLRMMLNCVLSRDFSELVQEESIPLRERLAIAFRFLSDAELTRYLKERAQKLCQNGDIEGILLTGMTSRRSGRIPSGMDVIENYLDYSGDVQSAAILAALISPSMIESDGLKDPRVTRWVEAYHELLDGWKLFHFRCQFDIDRGKLLQDMIRKNKLEPFEWVQRQIAIRCQMCKKTINIQNLPAPGAERVKVSACPNCQKKLPRCSVCLLHLGFVDDESRNAELQQQTTLTDTMDESLVFCQTCRHGGHSSHILAWFFGVDNGTNSHDVCPVADCSCRCLEE